MVLNHEYNGTDPRFCPVVFGLLTPDGDQGGFRITLASGGRPPAFVDPRGRHRRVHPRPGGQLIGVLPDAHISTTTLRLDPGDTPVLHTDGLTEAHTAIKGDRYGDEALLDFGRELAPTTAAHVITAICELLDTLGTGVDDDPAVLAVSVPHPKPEIEHQ